VFRRSVFQRSAQKLDIPAEFFFFCGLSLTQKNDGMEYFSQARNTSLHIRYDLIVMFVNHTVINEDECLLAYDAVEMS
jgi:hypothetical protein